MKRFLSGVFFFLLSLFNNARAEGTPLSPPLQELLDLFGMRAEDTKERWLQKGKERWEFDRRYEYMRPLAWPLFEEIGLIFETVPQRKHYRYALLFGALLSTAQKRIDYLADLWKGGIHFDQIVFLSGARPLLESERAICGVETEAEMIEWSYRRSSLPKDIPTHFINAPMKRGLEGTLLRPQTADTILEWLKTKPQEGSCLGISNQPYVGYQDAVLKASLPNGFEQETVGPEIQGDPSVALLLDTIAKQLLYSNNS